MAAVQNCSSDVVKVTVNECRQKQSSNIFKAGNMSSEFIAINTCSKSNQT